MSLLFVLSRVVNVCCWLWEQNGKEMDLNTVKLFRTQIFKMFFSGSDSCHLFLHTFSLKSASVSFSLFLLFYSFFLSLLELGRL